MRVLLVIPNFFMTTRTFEQDAKEPLGLLYLTSVLRAEGHIVDVFDAARYGMSLEQTLSVIQTIRPDIVGLSIVQRAVVSSATLVDLLRRRGTVGHICVGGYFPTLATEGWIKVAPGVDSIVIGEGEETFRELVACLDAGRDWRNVPGVAWPDGDGVIYAPPREKIADLDSIPFPARDLLPEALREAGYASLCSSRGCYGRCTFCS